MRARWNALVQRVELLGAGLAVIETPLTAIERLWGELGTPFDSRRLDGSQFELNDWGWAGWSVYEICVALKSGVSSAVGVEVVRRLLWQYPDRPSWLKEEILVSYWGRECTAMGAKLDDDIARATEVRRYAFGQIQPRELPVDSASGQGVNVPSVTVWPVPSLPLPSLPVPMPSFPLPSLPVPPLPVSTSENGSVNPGQIDSLGNSDGGSYESGGMDQTRQSQTTYSDAGRSEGSLRQSSQSSVQRSLRPDGAGSNTSPAHSNAVPKASPAHSNAVPKASPAHSNAVPKASPAHSNAVPKESPAHSNAVPKASPAHSNAVPKASSVRQTGRSKSPSPSRSLSRSKSPSRSKSYGSSMSRSKKKK